MSRGVCATKPESRLQALSSRCLGALQKKFSRKFKVTSRVVNGSETLPQIPLAALVLSKARVQPRMFKVPQLGDLDTNWAEYISNPAVISPSQFPVFLISVPGITSRQAVNLKIILDPSFSHSNPESCQF